MGKIFFKKWSTRNSEE